MMTKLSRRMFRLNMKRKIMRRVSVLHRHFSSFWNRILACLTGKSRKYRQLLPQTTLGAVPTSGRRHVPIRNTKFSSSVNMPEGASCCQCDHDRDINSSDLVALKISLFGDSHIGKTTFLRKYVGKESCGEDEELESNGVNEMDKTLCVRGARISYSIWDLKGDNSSVGHIPAACEDSVAMLFMFDLTSRSTLNSVIGWYQQARKWNQSGIPVIVGTKFDEFVQLPLDLQWTIATQAQAYAKALNATLFFSSATYNINVNKIFKFISAKLFNLPWHLERNLTIGEPIIDF